MKMPAEINLERSFNPTPPKRSRICCLLQFDGVVFMRNRPGARLVS